MGSEKKDNNGTIVERHLENKQHQMLMHEQGYTQSDMRKFHRTANEKWDLPDERAYYRDQYKVVQPYRGGGNDIVKTEAHMFQHSS